tara:strand:+ start:4586 stop:5668 length:1083 start_codon:yes stop_codon:yes gene_type:complete
MIDQKFDCIIIGSSPLMLIEALYNSKLKKSVLVIESKNFVGGSWHCFNKTNFANDIEIGCHIWQKNYKVISFLKETFDLNLTPRNPQPKVIFNNLKLPYSFINLLLIFRKISFISLFKFNNIRLYKSLFFDFLEQWFNSSKYYYPEGGSNEFVLKIISKIKKSSVKLITGKSVVTINLNDKTIICDDKSKIKFNEIISTNKLEINEIILTNNEVFKLNKRIAIIHNLYLLVENNLKNNLSYAETFGEKIVYRLSDMTYNYNSLISKNLKLFCIDIFPSAYEEFSENELIEMIIKKLKKWNYIDDSPKIISHFFNSYSYNGQSNEIISLFNKKMSSDILFLKSNNLIPSLADNIERWNKIF